MASPAVDYARGNQQRFLNELKDLLRIPSISTLQEHKSDVHKAADFVANELRRIGMEHVETISTKGHPLVYADWLHAPGKPTVLAAVGTTFARDSNVWRGTDEPCVGLTLAQAGVPVLPRQASCGPVRCIWSSTF